VLHLAGACDQAGLPRWPSSPLMWLHHGHCPDFESYPQWNDEVRVVYAMTRHDDGRPHLLAIAPYFPTKEVRMVQLQI
jgi:hypothetical protein